jgi:hypothetical protein
LPRNRDRATVTHNRDRATVTAHDRGGVTDLHWRMSIQFRHAYDR